VLAESNSNAAQRIIALSPHLAELVFAVGAGDRLIGVSAYTDYPEAAAKLPVIGDAFMLDLERLTVLKPDLLLAWQSGTPAHVVDELRSRGYRVEVIGAATDRHTDGTRHDREYGGRQFRGRAGIAG
jgi:iron complex transport system substrate-binding protein